MMTEEQVQEVLEKYDPESRYRRFTGPFYWITALGLLGFSIFQLYTAIFGVLPAQQQRSVHLAFALGLIYLLFPASRHQKKRFNARWLPLPWYDLVFSILGVFVGLYWVVEYKTLVAKSVVDYTTFDLTVAGLAIILVLEAARRVVGLPITIVAGSFLLYAFFGQYLPGFINHPGLTFKRVMGTMYFTTEGILGTPLMVSSTYVFLFLLFGSFLVMTGVGQYFIDFAQRIAGKRIGGPAKVAVFSSALMGTISGSSISNVVSSGVYTIPMMKRIGYSKEFAGGVEASASTGGQIMPPIMGAAAFLMVEFIGGGLTYWDVVKAATIPAVLYFTGIWMMTHLEAKRIGLRGLSAAELPELGYILKNLYLLAPIVAVILLLMNGFSVTRSALMAIVVAIVVGFIHRGREMKFMDIIEALINGARSALSVAAATACAGIIVGVVTLTGLGLKMANGLLELAGGSLILTLMFTMVACLIIGMGTPTTANYIITSTIAAPAIIMLGVPALSAHLFVFYFGLAADITPPVALAAFAASGISGGEPMRTGVNSAKLAIAAFLIPYVFVLSPELILVYSEEAAQLPWWNKLLSTGWVFLTAFLGMLAISVGIIGHWVRKVMWFERILAVIAGLLLVYPEGISDMVGLVIFVVLLVMQYLIKNNPNMSKLQEA